MKYEEAVQACVNGSAKGIVTDPESGGVTTVSADQWEQMKNGKVRFTPEQERDLGLVRDIYVSEVDIVCTLNADETAKALRAEQDGSLAGAEVEHWVEGWRRRPSVDHGDVPVAMRVYIESGPGWLPLDGTMRRALGDALCEVAQCLGPGVKRVTFALRPGYYTGTGEEVAR